MDGGKNIFLLRAFGDFIIAVHLASKNTIESAITLIASKHLEPLYTSLSLSLPSNVYIRFHDFGISNNLMGWFTDRYLLHPHSVTEMYRLRKYIRNHPVMEPYYLEHRRRSLLTGLACSYSFSHIISDQNVYKAYADFFSVPLQELENIPFTRHRKGIKVLIVPDARQIKRRIGNDIIEKIKAAYQGEDVSISVALFGSTKDPAAGETIARYDNFTELISLIKETDIVIGGDSMPVHIAQLLGKPHYILYPRYVKDQFFTPFVLKHKSYFTFEDIKTRKSFFPDGE